MAAEVRERALKLLTIREHSTLELQRKLCSKGFDAESVTSTLHALSQEGLLSDERFTEAFVASRRERGFGPRRITMELRDRGVDDNLVAQHIHESDRRWWEKIQQVRLKRFGAEIPQEYEERARQSRFLQYRGFTSEQIKWVFHPEDDF